ncbi:MAG TPA: hypothetical protein VHA55_08730 [Pseudorhodoplanes sp.]|jgi:hypothetical protein|nr:hypothetical protein [Pseudorhodoplanes sp.]
MRNFRHARLALLGAVIAVALAGCESFDPTSLTDFIPDSKKKLPGERKELFPGGVPGVTQGVPQDLVKGNQPPADQNAAAQPPSEPQPEDKPTEKPKAKSKPKTKTVRAAKPQPQDDSSAAGAVPQTQAASPWPAQPQQGGQQPWPAPAR